MRAPVVAVATLPVVPKPIFSPAYHPQIPTSIGDNLTPVFPADFNKSELVNFACLIPLPITDLTLSALATIGWNVDMSKAEEKN